jgi:predicted amidohydrolase
MEPEATILKGCERKDRRMSIPAYWALPLQIVCDAVNQDATPEAARARIAASIARADRLLEASRRFMGHDIKLVVLPEYAFTGFPMGESTPLWRAKAAFDPTGAEYAALSAMAARQGVYLAVSAYETDALFPALYLQTSSLIAPDGTFAYRYRRLISLYGPSPLDIWERYLDAYGADAIFPVADTPLGRIAPIASEEVLYPEIVRAFGARGAQVFAHSTSEIALSAPTSPKNIAKAARAIENMAYVVSANTAGITGCPAPEASADGYSKIVDFHGRTLVEAAQGESMSAAGEIDLAALARWRRRPGLGNIRSRLPMALFAETYAGLEGAPRSALLDESGAVTTPAPDFYRARQTRAIEALDKAGLL